jgi:tetratricopeptide (TPR) repeat protein
MHHLRISHLALWTVALVAASAAPAGASPRGEKLHKQALVAAEAGSYVKAKGLWEEAYRLDAEPKYLFNLGVIAEESDKPLEALTYYERFLKQAPDTPAYKALRVKATARVKALGMKVAILEISATQPGVEVFIDQRAVGKGPLQRSMRLSQGDHLVVATLAGHHGQTHKLKLMGGQTRKIDLVLKRIEAGKVSYPMPRWLPWTVLGGGLAIALAGIVPMVLQVKAFDDYNDSIIPGLVPNGDLSLKKKGDRLYASGIALLAVGGAAAVAGLVMVLLNRPKAVREEPKTVETFIGPGSVSMRVRF